MEPNAMFRRNVRTFYAYVGSLVLAGLAPAAAFRLTMESITTLGRVAGVLVGVGGWVPLGLLMFRLIQRGDEYTRRIHLVALALAFAGAMFLISLLDWLTRAEFIPPLPLMVVWMAIAVWWVIAVFISKHMHEK
jgi:hypothetical protein